MKSLERKLKRSRPLLGTFIEIELSGSVDELTLNTWITQGFEAVGEIDSLMSIYRADSDISRLNQAAPHEWLGLNPLTLKVLQASNHLFEMSGGIFDIRCEASPDKACPPLEFRGSSARKTGPWQFDLGGIAKGFAVDHAVERIQLLTGGFPISGSVNAGGDLRVWGRGAVPSGAGVRGQGAFWLQPFVVRETAVATSSVRSSEDSDLTAAIHRQMPSATPLKKEQTVTVFADQCLWADALTKVVLMGSEQLAKICLMSHNAKALIFWPDGRPQKALG